MRKKEKDISAVYIREISQGEEILEKFVVKGGRRLHGEVEISGAKNAAVGIIPAVILSDEPCILEKRPGYQRRINQPENTL